MHWLILALLAILPLASATSVLFEFHADVGPSVGEEGGEAFVVPAGTTGFVATFTARTPSGAPAAVFLLEVGITDPYGTYFACKLEPMVVADGSRSCSFVPSGIQSASDETWHFSYTNWGWVHIDALVRAL